MAIDLVMPKLGLTMTEGVIQEWIAEPGAAFSAGSVLLVVETEKIASEVEATADGVLEQILAEPGATVACGAAIARWTPKDPQAAAAAKSSRAEATAVPENTSQSVTPAARPTGDGSARVIATPFARRVARELGVDLSEVKGSGPRGRIKGPDVRAFAATVSRTPQAAPAPLSAPAAATTLASAARPSASRRPATAFEQATAERLTAAKQVPHFYLSTEVEVGALEALRKQLGALEGKPKVSVTHLLLAALARTLTDVPSANQVWDAGEIVQYGQIDLGVAVSTERGLLAPMLRNVGDMRIHDLAESTRELVSRTRAGKLTPDDFGGGATAVSNAGMHDVTSMTSIITPGHSSIFGVGSVRELFRPGPKGEPTLHREMAVVMSCDHRVLDGVAGLAVLNRLKFYLENPLQIVV